MIVVAPNLDEARIRSLLEKNRFVQRVEVIESTTSTNDEARKLAAEGAPSGTAVISNAQTAGRGRLGRSWHSPPGLGLYLSVLCRPSGTAPEAMRWTVVSSLAACEACIDVAGCAATIQWPNDVCHEGKKLAGTLAELRSNVNLVETDFPRDLRHRATSLRLASGGASVDREALASSYLWILAERTELLDRGGWNAVRSAWHRLSPTADGRRVRVHQRRTDRSFDGVTRGIDDSGALRVERPDGTVSAVHLGESVTPLEA
jgi:BirA family biotin operon repressor/biotin-[acetyl-CoA-carboxylase] ligase